MTLLQQINQLCQSLKHLNNAYAAAGDFIRPGIKASIIQLQNELDLKLEILLTC